MDSETREIDFRIKSHAIIYDKEAIAGVQDRRKPGYEGEIDTIEYSCGDELVQSALAVIPAACPDCGAPLTERGNS